MSNPGAAAQAGNPEASDPAGTPDQFRAHLVQVLLSRQFLRAAGPSRLLRYAAERAIDGDSGPLPEALLAVELFDRDASFDPAADSIVRTEMARISSLLAAYYEAEGAAEPLRIHMDPATYSVRFCRAAAASEPPAARAGASKTPWLAAAIVMAAALFYYWIR